jgi:type I restriction-modification system DNA methylase subunit
LEKRKAVLSELLNKMRSRIPAEHVPGMIFSYAYNHGNEVGYAGKSTEYLNYAKEIIERIPSDFKIDLENLLECQSKGDFEDIKKMLYKILKLDNVFIDMTVENLSKLVLELLNLEEGDELFDLGLGRGNFLVDAIKLTEEKSIKLKNVSGVDINMDNVYLANIALEILCEYTRIEDPARYANILTDNIYTLYNKGYTFPPMNMRVSGGDINFQTIFKDIKLTGRNSIELVFIDKLLKNLKGNNRRAIALVNGRVLFNYSGKKYREALVKSGLLEGIIELPENILSNTSVKTFLLIFSDNNEKVKLLDASKLIVKNMSSLGKNILDVETILSIYKNDEVETKTKEELLELQNWIPSKALLEVYTPENGVKLSDVAKVFTGTQYTLKRFEQSLTDEKSGYRILTSSDIEDGLINWNNLKRFKSEDNRFDKYAVKLNDLIVTSKSSKVKMAVVDITPEEKIIVTGGMLIVRPNTTKINTTFLKIFLESDQGQNILKSIQKGMTIVSINASALAGITIPLPNIQKQLNFAVKYESKLASLLAYKKEIENIENELKNFYYEEVEGE